MENGHDWFGKDADDAAMAMDRRSLFEQIKEAINKLTNRNWKNPPVANGKEIDISDDPRL